MKIYFLAYAFFFLVGTVFVPCSLKASTKTLVQVGKKRISLEEFNKRLEQSNSLGSSSNSLSKKEALQNVINFELAVQEAKKQKLDQKESVQNQLNIILYRQLIEEKIQPRVNALQVSESEVRDYYKKNPLVRTRHIVFLLKPDMGANERQKVKEKAVSVHKKVLNGKVDFEDLAKEYSEGPSAKTGGDVDWGARHKLLAEYYNASLSLKAPGKVSQLVETPYGYHIIKLEGIKEFSQIDSTYKNYIIRTIKEIRGKKLYDEYFAELKNRISVSVNEDLLK